MTAIDLGCRCPGFEGDAECGAPATEEDGFCDSCRCEHGCCVDHGSPKVGLTWEQRLSRPFDMDADIEAWRFWGACRDRRGMARA